MLKYHMELRTMTCCGQRPINNPAAPIRTTPGRTTPSGPLLPSGPQFGPSGLGGAYNTVLIRYVRGPAIVVRGSVTGRRYTFSGNSPVQAVDARDAAQLLSTSLFRRR